MSLVLVVPQHREGIGLLDSMDTAYDSQLDEPLADSLLLSTRISNALLRHNVVTLRLLIMYTPELLLENIANLGSKSLAEIEAKLAATNWRLAEAADRRQVKLIMALVSALHGVHYSRQLADLVSAVNRSRFAVYSADEVMHILTHHPYFVTLADGSYCFQVRADGSPGAEEILPASQYEVPAVKQDQAIEDSALDTLHSASIDSSALEPDASAPIDLFELWSVWYGRLKSDRKRVLLLFYGIHGEAPMTLQEVGDEVGITRERVRQIVQHGLRDLAAGINATHLKSLHAMLSQALQSATNLLTTHEWERWLDERAIWESNEQRPLILPLLCDLLDDFHYLEQYDVATLQTIQPEHVAALHDMIHVAFRRCRRQVLAADELVCAVQNPLPTAFPRQMLEPGFILKAVTLSKKVRVDEDGRYVYWRYERQRVVQSLMSLGKPGTRLYEWETLLRSEFKRIAWIGQITCSEDAFLEMCQAIREEAKTPNYHSKVLEGNPMSVPPAVFVTAMVLSARYAELTSSKAADEFWTPYLRTVWGVEYSHAFYVRCKNRFNAVVPFLEQEFGFEFPRTGRAQGDVVTPLFRHALIPRYMQHDFAAWLRKNWRSILDVSEVPALLAAHLQQDRSLETNYSHRLKKFITGSATASAAASLIINMSAAISLHVNDGESIDRIGELLHDTPIEQELWQEIAQEFTNQTGDTTALLRVVQPKVTWVWSLDKEELNLRVQNIIVPVTSGLVGTPDRVVWLASTDDDPLRADIEEEVFPWRMKTGERVVAEVLLREPKGPAGGSIALMTDMDEIAARLNVPERPADQVQFFRPIQQGAYGIPLDFSQITDGTWLVCADAPLVFIDDDDEMVTPDSELSVPYPLGTLYTWAAQVTLSLPVRVMQGSKCMATLEVKENQLRWAPPILSGSRPVAQLSRQAPPTFADTRVEIRFDFGGERLLKQVSLWLKGADGWRCHRSLAELSGLGHVMLVEDCLIVQLAEILPTRPNSYILELRASLTTISPAPMQFAVVPGLSVEPPGTDRVYTPANPPRAVLYGVDVSHIVPSDGLHIQPLPNQGAQVTWADLRHDPSLVLHIGNVDIPLVWPAPCFAIWLEPKLAKSFYTIDELQQARLQALCSDASVSGFTLSIGNQRGRYFSLTRGRYSNVIGQTQLYDMVRLAMGRMVKVDVRVGTESWLLCQVRSWPELTKVSIRYGMAEQLLRLDTGLTESWAGDVRFWAESLTQPFSPPVLFGRADQIEPQHTFSTHLADGAYVFGIELDSVKLSLPGSSASFVVGDEQEPLADAEALIQEIRSGRVISSRRAEDFVLMWAESAERGTAALTPSTLYQLATIGGHALENFQAIHLRRLWSPLASLHAVRERSSWIESHGLLPAWVILEQPVILKTLDRGCHLPVYPLYVANRGRTGRGFGDWRLSTVADAPKECVYVEWTVESELAVHIEAALPEGLSIEWAQADLLEMYGLYYCTRCRRLTGARALPLPSATLDEHKHGDAPISLRDITRPVDAGGHKMLAEFYIDRRAPQLVESYATFGMACPSAAEHLPEPSLTSEAEVTVLSSTGSMEKLIRDLIRLGDTSDECSPLAAGSRLLAAWQQNGEVRLLGQFVLSVGMLLRMAAYNVDVYRALLKKCALTEYDVQQMLSEVNGIAPKHMEWGLTWAELLVIHST